MSPIEWLLLGVALGAIPSSDLARLAVAILAKRAGVEPQDIKKYNSATDE